MRRRWPAGVRHPERTNIFDRHLGSGQVRLTPNLAPSLAPSLTPNLAPNLAPNLTPDRDGAARRA
jgi:hypothetical protein